MPPPPAQWAYGEHSLLQYDGALLQFASCMEGVAQYAYALHVEQYEGAFEQSAPELIPPLAPILPLLPGGGGGLGDGYIIPIDDSHRLVILLQEPLAHCQCPCMQLQPSGRPSYASHGDGDGEGGGIPLFPIPPPILPLLY